MTLIVEDGTGLPNAESYASVASADAQMAALGITIWSGLVTEEKEQALRRATQYMEQAYRLRWHGYRTTNVQALSWPRSEVPIPDSPGRFAGYYTYVDEYSVPSEVSRACIDLAVRAAAGELLADQSQQVTREKIGPIETEYTPYGTQAKQYPAITSLLAPYFQYAPGTVTAVRR
jgi:hypothetical protein